MEDVICVLWPDTVIVPYGSYASGMMTADSDVDMVVSVSTAVCTIFTRYAVRPTRPVIHTCFSIYAVSRAISVLFWRLSLQTR